MTLFFTVLAVSACVLGVVFTAMYFLNRAVDQSDR
jgi:hypothetical protein